MSEHWSNYKDTAKDFWESCDETFAHLKINKWLENYEKITAYWETRFLTKLDLKGDSVIEYGIGGGYLGKYLLNNNKISNYIGIDIAERSLIETRQNLSAFADKISLYNSTVDFESLKADIFISQACIQHFPSIDYFIIFLEKVARCHFKKIMLQYRFSETTFHVENNPVLSLFTNAKFIKKYLTNYQTAYLSDIEENGYQFLILSRKDLVDLVEETSLNKKEAGFYELNYFRLRDELTTLRNKYEGVQQAPLKRLFYNFKRRIKSQLLK